MDFVVLVLMRFFGHSEQKATEIMWQVHTQGKGVCGIYSKEIAETKMMQVNRYSRSNGHPLLCQIELHDE
jgi:ATP-dependent Clp protease adaptor protein ClpS